MASHVKLPLARQAFPYEHWLVLAVPLPIQLPANVSRKAEEGPHT